MTETVRNHPIIIRCTKNHYWEQSNNDDIIIKHSKIEKVTTKRPISLEKVSWARNKVETDKNIKITVTKDENINNKRRKSEIQIKRRTDHDTNNQIPERNKDCIRK